VNEVEVNDDDGEEEVDEVAESINVGDDEGRSSLNNKDGEDSAASGSSSSSDEIDSSVGRVESDD